MKIIKYILFILIFVILSLPLIQKFSDFFEEEPLKGEFIEASRELLNWNTWISETFQNQYDPYFNETVGFRSDFIRLNNQLDLSFFNIPHAEGVIAGKERCFYEEDYILEYTGKYFIGEDILTKKSERIKYVQNYLKTNYNKDLIIVFAPGKASFYPEYIPGKYHPEAKTQSNYDFYVQQFNKKGIDYIDLNKLFIEMKDTVSYPIYTKYGIHWTAYGTSLAIDTLLNYIEHKRGIDLIDYHWDYQKKTKEILGTDYDIGNALNLMFKIPNDRLMSYPKILFHDDYWGKYKPNVMVVGDSYYWNIFNSGIPEHLFNNKTFWLYGNKIYPEYWKRDKTKADIVLKDEILKQEVIIVMITERFVFRSFWKFIDELYALFHPNYVRDPVYDYVNDIVNYDVWYQNVYQQGLNDGITYAKALKNNAEFIAYEKNESQQLQNAEIVYNKLIEYYIDVIKTDSIWFNKIQTKAITEGVELEDQIYEDAIWIVDHDNSNGIDPKKRLNKIIELYNNIRNDSVWLNNVNQKAIQNNIELDRMLVEDALWMYNQELNNQ